jgi:hypothetical protein
MTPRTIGVLLLKLWGLMSVVDGFVGVFGAALAAFGPAVEPGMNRYVLLTTAFGAIVNLVLGAVLLIGASRLVAIVEPEVDASDIAVRQCGLAELKSLLSAPLACSSRSRQYETSQR